MKIVVFGAKRCKFCRKQLRFLSNTFPNKDVLYVDVVNDKTGLEIAEDLNIEHLPTILLMDDQRRETFRKSGTLPADQVFAKVYPGKGLPVKKTPREKTTIFLSFDPVLAKGETVKIYSYGGKFLSEMRVADCHQKNVDLMAERDKKEYLESGGRKDISWLVELKPVDR
jgi:thiol-disulfide isomerase/thioredoxin